MSGTRIKTIDLHHIQTTEPFYAETKVQLDVRRELFGIINALNKVEPAKAYLF